jgi:hypothetical protein
VTVYIQISGTGLYHKTDLKMCLDTQNIKTCRHSRDYIVQILRSCVGVSSSSCTMTVCALNFLTSSPFLLCTSLSHFPGTLVSLCIRRSNFFCIEQNQILVRVLKGCIWFLAPHKISIVYFYIKISFIFFYTHLSWESKVSGLIIERYLSQKFT